MLPMPRPRTLPCLLLSLMPAITPASSPIEKNFHFSVDIEARFNPSYQILGRDGHALTYGQVTLDAVKRLRTVTTIPVSVWQIAPDGSSRSPVAAYRMKWTEVSAEYSGEYASEPIPASLIKVTVDQQEIGIGSSFDLNSGLLGYNQVAIHSDDPLPASESGNNRLVVRLAAVFENVIE